MNMTDRVESFIHATRSSLREGSRPLPPGTQPFVTITSQTGAGGNRLAEALMHGLGHGSSASPEMQGWRLFDKSMCQRVLQQEHLSDSMNELLNEDYHSQLAELVMGIFGDRGMQNVAYARLARFLRTIAAVGKVIIIGHGAGMATHNLSGGIHVRLVAPQTVRAERMASLMDQDVSETLKEIQRRDEDHNRLLRTHYRIDGADPEHYDLVFNTDRIGIDTVAELLLQLLSKQSDSRSRTRTRAQARV